LDYAHRAGIFHGNLRPKNIFTGLDDEIYVANFSVLTNRKKDILFTNAYQSPEECDGGAASAPSDIYALSVIAYELLANRLPVLQDTAATPLPIQGVPGDVDAVLQRGMAKDPYDRYSTCLELVECLEQGLKSTSKVKISPVKPAESTPASPVIAAGVKKTDKRNTAGRYLLGGSILCLLIGGAVCGLFYQDLLQHPQKNGKIAGIGVKQEQEQEQPQPEPVQPAAVKMQEPAAPITEEPQEPVMKPAAPAEHTEPVNTDEQVTEEQPEPAVEPAIPAENTEPPVYEEPATEKGQESAVHYLPE
jgi:hypothetical protein